MKKTKKRGFTLIELLVSMVFISFVIVMSSALFDRAIHSDRQIRQAVVKNTEEFSNMDNFLSEAKDYVTFYKLKGSGESYAKKNNLENEYTKYKNYSEESRKLKEIKLPDMNIGNYKVDKVYGYYISIDDEGKRQLNSVKNSDKFVTFIGVTTESDATSSIGKLSISDNYFEFMDRNDKKEIKLNYSIQKDKSEDLFSSINFGLLKSEVLDSTGKKINTIFSRMNQTYNTDFSNADSLVDFADIEKKDKDGEYVFKLKNNSFADYLKTIDRTFLVEASTINKNGLTGSLVSTLSNAERNKSKFKYYVGIVALDKLYAMYSYDLAVAKDNTHNTIDSLLGSNNTNFKDCIEVVNRDDYGVTKKFNWKNYDVRNFLGLSNTTLDNSIKISESFMETMELEANSEPPPELYKNGYSITERKSYGSTMYHIINEKEKELNKKRAIPPQEKEKKRPTIKHTRKLDSGESYLNGNSLLRIDTNSNYSKFIILKINLNNYNNIVLDKPRLTPIQLLSINYDTDNNKQKVEQVGGKKKGALSVVLLDGKLYENKIEIKNNVTTNYTMKYLDYDMLKANLYTDSPNFKFDTLDYFTFKDYEKQIGTPDSVDGNIGAIMKKSRDGRENFIILGILLKRNSNKLYYEIYSLNRRTTETDGSILYIQNINNGYVNKDSSEMPIDKIEIGKHVKLMQNPNISSGPKNQRDYNKNNIPDVVEVSDIMIFDTESVDKDMVTNMVLLYRRYLTERERERVDKTFSKRY